MNDPRLSQLAEILVDHSCQLKSGEKVLIEAIDLPDPNLVCRLIELVVKRKGIPLISWKNNAVLRTLYQSADEEALKLAGKFERARMQEMDAYIGIRGAANSNEFADVPHEKMDSYQKLWWYPVHSEAGGSSRDDPRTAPIGR